MKTKTVTDNCTIESAFEGAKQDLNMLAEEMRSWADNMSGTPLESTMKYEQVEDCASELEDAISSVENVEISEENKAKNITFGYLMPSGKYIGRSWRAGQISSALSAIGEVLEDDELKEVAEQVGNLEFPGMY